jgi:hypothetical protein
VFRRVRGLNMRHIEFQPVFLVVFSCFDCVVWRREHYIRPLVIRLWCCACCEEVFNECFVVVTMRVILCDGVLFLHMWLRTLFAHVAGVGESFFFFCNSGAAVSECTTRRCCGAQRSPAAPIVG